MVSGRVYSDQALGLGKATTLAGRKLAIRAQGGQASVAGSRLLTVDIEARNGVIHVIDQVILPDATEVSRAPSRECPLRELAARLDDALRGCSPRREQAAARARHPATWY